MLLGLLAWTVAASASSCSFIQGNWYCSETSEVVYTGLGGVPGTYQRVTNMDADSCTCTKSAQPFSGPLSPLDEDLSIHFRGPISLKQLAVYNLATITTVAHRKRDQAVYTLPPPISMLTTPATQSTTSTATTTSTTMTSTSPSAAAVTSTSTVWQRSSYYNSASGTSDNLVFLNNMGGVNGSGTWSSCFGNSLSYASVDGQGAAAQPQVLGDVTLPSNTEFSVFSAEACTSATCGYVSPGVPAYVGFSGANKLFLMEFSMPSDPSKIGTFNGDMPAVWMLNGQIPRSQQYGACSCWQTGCGELDLFEVLSGGLDYATTTLHTYSGGGAGSSNYFARPTQGTLKAAVLFTAATSQISIIVLPQSTTFDATFAQNIATTWSTTDITNVAIVS
ncbi:target of Sbf [Savitreella phatthalungensis]